MKLINILNKSCIIALGAAVALMALACAKQGYPSGGPRDVTPPKMVGVTPAQGATNFDGTDFFIEFDEYVVLKDVENNVLVSPPMDKKPEYSTKGRGVKVQMKDTLKPNTTYLFQFKGAIADFTEGNALESFEYVFSTGALLDSMTLRGKVTDALTLTPCEGLSVLLYRDPGEWEDSTIAKSAPAYVTRTNKEGYFAFNHIGNDTYRAIAIRDEDKNLRYGAGEAIAFVDEILTPRCQYDSVPLNDSTMICAADKQPTEMRLSLKKEEVQRVAKDNFMRKGRLQLAMQTALKNPEIACNEPMMVRYSKGMDTVDIWTLREGCDSLQLVLSDATGFRDTLTLKYREKKKNRATAEGPKFVKSTPGSKCAFFDTLWLSFENPVKRGIATPKFEIMNMADSSLTYSEIRMDSLGLRGYIDFAGKPGGKYRFRMGAGMLADIYGRKNDSIAFAVELTTPENYGSLKVTLDPVKPTPTPCLVQLLDEKDNMVKQQPCAAQGVVNFVHLKGGKYKLRMVLDANGNGQWDPGDYWKHLQPEKVIYFEKTLELRENWEMEESWMY